VDEGHKGLVSGNKWKSLREQISKIGFTFEYSATFEEAIPTQRDELMEEYSKAIILIIPIVSSTLMATEKNLKS